MAFVETTTTQGALDELAQTTATTSGRIITGHENRVHEIVIGEQANDWRGMSRRI